MYFLLPLLLVGCAHVTPVSEPPSAYRLRPQYTTVAVSGPEFESRVFYTDPDEDFDPVIYEDLLRRTLEQTGYAGRAVPVPAHGEQRTKIVATLGEIRETTRFRQKVWNFLNNASLLWMAGLPYRAEQENDVRLDVYEGGRLVDSATGTGRVHVTSTIYRSLTAIRRANREATRLAILDAAARLADDSPGLPDLSGRSLGSGVPARPPDD